MQRLQLTLVIVLLTQVLQVVPAEALTYDEIVLLTQAERKVFGAVDNSHSFDERIKALESNTGSHAAGSESKRIRSVCAKLGLIAPEPAAAVSTSSAAKEKAAKVEAAKLEAARVAEQKKNEQKKALKEARSDEQNKLKERHLAELAAAKKDEQEKLRELKQLQAEEKRRKAESAKEAQALAQQQANARARLEANKATASAVKPKLTSQVKPNTARTVASAAGSATSSAPSLLPDSMQQKSAANNNSNLNNSAQSSIQENTQVSSNSGTENTQGAQSGVGVIIAAVVVVLVLGCLGTVIFLFLKAAGNTEKPAAFEDEAGDMDEQFPHRHPIASGKKRPKQQDSRSFDEPERPNLTQPNSANIPPASGTAYGDDGGAGGGRGVVAPGPASSPHDGAPVFMPYSDVRVPRTASGAFDSHVNTASGFSSTVDLAPVPVHLPQPDVVDAPGHPSQPQQPTHANPVAVPDQNTIQRRGSETFSVIESLLSREKQAIEAKKQHDNVAHGEVFVPNSTPNSVLDAWGPSETDQKNETLPPFPGQSEAPNFATLDQAGSVPAFDANSPPTFEKNEIESIQNHAQDTKFAVASAQMSVSSTIISEPTPGLAAHGSDLAAEATPQGKEKRPFPFGGPKPPSSSSAAGMAKPSPLEETITLSAAEISASLAGIGDSAEFLEDHQGSGSIESDEQLAAFADAILSTAESSSAPAGVSSAPSLATIQPSAPVAKQAPPVPPVRPVPPMPPTPPGATALAHPSDVPHHKPTNKDLRSLFSGDDVPEPASPATNAGDDMSAAVAGGAPSEPMESAHELSNTAAQSNYASNAAVQPQFKTVHDFMYEQKKPIQYKKCPRCAFSYSIDARNCLNDGEVLDLVELDPAVIFSFGDRYEVEAVIASGGMSILYQARHKMLNRSVAIKVMDPQMAKNHSAVKRFQQEAQLICQMSHPNVVRVHDFGSNSSGQPFIVMDYLTGRTITQILDEEGQISWDRARNIFLQLASGLSHAHKLGVIHRDIKPTNVVVTQDEFGGEQATIVDFGIAKMSTPDSREKFTLHGETVGTPMYMSPEQCRGSEVDYRTDVYSLGTLMFETLTGKTPFIASSAFEMRQMIVTAPAPKLADIRPDLIVPPICESIVKRCLQKDPSLRFQNLDELISELAQS